MASVTPDEERNWINNRWAEIDRELDAWKRRRDLPEAVQVAHRARLLGEQDQLEHRLGELYLAERTPGAD